MTKAQMIEAIQEAEAQAWMEYNRYCWLSAPTEKGYKAVCDWQSEDPTARAYRAAWCSFHDLMGTLKIEPLYNEAQNKATEYHSQLYRACKEAE